MCFSCTRCRRPVLASGDLCGIAGFALQTPIRMPESGLRPNSFLIKQLYGPQPLKQTQRQAKNSDIWEIHFETQGFDPRVFVLSGLPDVISSFACQSRWHSGRAGWLAHINHGSLGEFEGASPCNLRPQAAKRPRERRSHCAPAPSPPRIGGDNGRTM